MGTSYEQGRPASPGGAGPAGGRPPPWGGRGGGGGPAALYLDVPPTAATGPHQSDTQVPHGRGWTKRVFSPAAIPPAATTAHHHRGFYPPAGGNDPEAARPPPDPADVSSALAAAQFAETSMRNGFVAKVFGLVGTMLAATVGFAALTMFHPGVKVRVVCSSACLFGLTFCKGRVTSSLTFPAYRIPLPVPSYHLFTTRPSAVLRRRTCAAAAPGCTLSRGARLLPC